MKILNINSSLKLLFYLYITFLPLQDIKLFPFNIGKGIFIADIIFIPLFSLWIIKLLFHRNNNPFVEKNIIYSILIFISVFSLATFFSKNSLRSFVDLVGLIYLILLFLLSVDILKDEKTIYNSMKLWVIVALSVIFIGLFAFLISILTNNYNSNNLLMYDPIKKSIIPFPRMNSTFQTQEMLISYMIITLGFLFILFDKNPFWLTGIPVVIFGVIIAFSRGLIGFLITWIICIYAKIGNTIKKFILMPSIVLFLFLSISIYVSSKWILFPFEWKVDKQTEQIKISFGISPGQREIFNKTAINMWKDNFLLGVGPGEFTYQFKNYVDFDRYKNSWSALENIAEVDPHSTYYGALAETGILGFLSLMLLFSIILYQSLRYINNRTIVFLSASFIGLLLNGFICDIIMFRHLWLLFGFLYAYHQLNTPLQQSDKI